MHRQVLSAFTLLSALVACRESTAPDPCSGALAVNVSGVAQPIFTWSPACGISALSITTVPSTQGEASRAVWGFTVSEQLPLGPGITYGISPERANVWTGPESLGVGKTYRVSIMYTVGGDVAVASGEATFTWWPPD